MDPEGKQKPGRLQHSSLPSLQAVILHRADWIGFRRPLVWTPWAFGMFCPKLCMWDFTGQTFCICAAAVLGLCCVTHHTHSSFPEPSLLCSSTSMLPEDSGQSSHWIMSREHTEPQQDQKEVCVLDPGLGSLFRVGQVRLSLTRHRLGLLCLVSSLATAGLGWQTQRWKSEGTHPHSSECSQFCALVKHFFLSFTVFVAP